MDDLAPLWCGSNDRHQAHSRRNKFGGTDYCSGRPGPDTLSITTTRPGGLGHQGDNDMNETTCYICGYEEHAPSAEHEFWSIADAKRWFDREPVGVEPSMSAVETLDPREAVYS